MLSVPHYILHTERSIAIMITHTSVRYFKSYPLLSPSPSRSLFVKPLKGQDQFSPLTASYLIKRNNSSGSSNGGVSDNILARHDDYDTGVTKLILNNPSKYNVLSSEMMELMLGQLEDISGNTSTRVLIVGANGKAFSSGHDLKEIYCHQKNYVNDNSNLSEQQPLHDLFHKCSEVMLAMNNLPQPVIASVQGVATAAGCQLVASCDLAVASQSSRFGVSGINAGLFCSTPAVALSRNVGRKRAMHMLLTGDLISAEEALDYGLVNKVVLPERLEEETMELATKIAKKSEFGIRLGKKMFYEQLKFDDLGDAYEFALERMVCNIGHEDARDGIDAFVNKKKP